MDYKALTDVDRIYMENRTGFVITGSRREYYGYCQVCGRDRAGAFPAGEPSKRHS